MSKPVFVLQPEIQIWSLPKVNILGEVWTKSFMQSWVSSMKNPQFSTLKEIKSLKTMYQKSIKHWKLSTSNLAGKNNHQRRKFKSSVSRVAKACNVLKARRPELMQGIGRWNPALQLTCHCAGNSRQGPLVWITVAISVNRSPWFKSISF